MAIGTVSDFKTYEEQFFGGMAEVLQQNVAGFNDQSAGAIRLSSEMQGGLFARESFFELPANLIQHRDPGSTTDATETKLTQGEVISAKINKRIGPVENTVDSFKKAGLSPEEMAFVLGQQSAPSVEGCFLNSAMAGLVGAFGIAGVSDLSYDATGEATTTMTHQHLVKGLSKMGDQATGIVAWVMHSKVYFDLVGHAVGEKLLEVTSGTIYGGSPGTFGRPVVVTDAPALVDTSGASDVYASFGLRSGAVDVIESEERSVLIETVGGKDNLVQRYQGEFAYNVRIKGFAWDTATSNPADTALATSTSWDLAASDIKNCAGVRILTE